MTIGILFVDTGTSEPYDPATSRRPTLTDEEYAAWVRYTYGPAKATELAEMYEAIAGSDG